MTRITGLATAWNEWSGWIGRRNDSISFAPAAFDAALFALSSGQQVCELILHHDRDLGVIARTDGRGGGGLRLWKTSDGLAFEATVASTTEAAAALRMAVAERLTRCSIGYQIVRSTDTANAGGGTDRRITRACLLTDITMTNSPAVRSTYCRVALDRPRAVVSTPLGSAAGPSIDLQQTMRQLAALQRS